MHSCFQVRAEELFFRVWGVQPKGLSGLEFVCSLFNMRLWVVWAFGCWALGVWGLGV